MPCLSVVDDHDHIINEWSLIQSHVNTLHLICTSSEPHVNTTSGTWRLLPYTSYSYHHQASMGRRLYMLHLTDFDLAHSSNYFCPSGHLAEAGGCGNLQAEVEVPSYEGS